jgi:superfamily I DNA/RNA helicase
VDEAQDLNRCQQQLALKAGRRLVLCGDPKQAIYGFAGADAESMNRMQKTLEATDRGCVHLPLTVTRRCGKAIVEEARKIVPDFDYWEDNPDGIVSSAHYKETKTGADDSYTGRVEDGDMILCRVNAPLVSQCFRFLKAGRKAMIQGRDVGQGLISTIKKMKAEDVGDLGAKLSDWLHVETQKENRKRNPNENKLIALQDRVDCLYCFMEDCSMVQQVIDKIEAVFTDDRDSIGIKLSSVHKAKGLEAKRVFALIPDGCHIPHPMAKSKWAIEQEWNIKYVMVTRAIEELVYVS